MAQPRFEGSYLGDDSRLAPTARMECKICWHVYDPAEGCDVWQVPPGTPFTALPDHWRCPVCDGEKAQFMLLDAGTGAAPAPRPEAGLAARCALLEDVFRDIAARDMAGIPVINDKLAVKAVGFRDWSGQGLGVLVTPWFMSLVLLPLGDDAEAMPVGSKRLVEFPSGRYEFVQGYDARLGGWEACSLFSPMFEFGTMTDAVEVAVAVMTALFDESIREGGAPTAEIRQRREAELAAAAAAEAAALVPEAEGAGASRRALLFGAAPAGERP